MYSKDYLIVVSPPDRIKEQIAKFKKSCAKYIGKFKGLYSEAHISLNLLGEEIVSANQDYFKFERYLDSIKNDLAKINSIELNITGFNFFNHGSKSKTIYASLDLPDETMNWFNILKVKAKNKKSITPHITIAKNISIEAFNILWPFFEKIEYKESFIADKLTVLVKENNGSFNP